MPTAAILTFSGNRLTPLKNPQTARRENVNLANGTYLAGTVLGPITATPGQFGEYATGNVDGSGVATLILEYDCVVASGLVTFGTASGGGEWRQQSKYAPAFRSGVFASADLVGMDAAGLAEMMGHIVRGDLTTGIVAIPG